MKKWECLVLAVATLIGCTHSKKETIHTGTVFVNRKGFYSVSLPDRLKHIDEHPDCLGIRFWEGNGYSGRSYYVTMIPLARIPAPIRDHPSDIYAWKTRIDDREPPLRKTLRWLMVPYNRMVEPLYSIPFPPLLVYAPRLPPYPPRKRIVLLEKERAFSGEKAVYIEELLEGANDKVWYVHDPMVWENTQSYIWLVFKHGDYAYFLSYAELDFDTPKFRKSTRKGFEKFLEGFRLDPPVGKSTSPGQAAHEESLAYKCHEY